jgi:hypothetical protein
LDFRNRLINLYPEIFEGGSEGTPDETQFSKKWGWMATIHILTDGDITKFEAVSRCTVHTAFSWAAYKSDFSKLEQTKFKKATR